MHVLCIKTLTVGIWFKMFCAVVKVTSYGNTMTLSGSCYKLLIMS